MKPSLNVRIIETFYWCVKQVADTIEEKLIRMDEGKKLSTFVEGNMTVQELLDLFVDNGQRFSQQWNFKI